MHKRLLLNIAAFLASIAGVLNSYAQDAATAIPFDSQIYNQNGATKGVVLLAVRWDRRWKCADYENAQLRRIGFDKLPTTRTDEDETADLVVADASLVMTSPKFDDYAFLVVPGEYALSSFQIKAAKSASDVRLSKVSRGRLIKGGKPEGGSFSVGPGEVIYIGHFYLDCYHEPSLWRYYPENGKAFNGYLAGVKKKYPDLDISKAQFRLFKTIYFGNDFQLK